MKNPNKTIKGVFVGMPAYLHLNYFGWLVHAAFGSWPYLVGSALQKKNWRDIDVRLILSDEEYEAMGLGDPAPHLAHQNPKWLAWTMAFSALAKELTGLPVDFQIEQQSHANKTYDGPRNALGIEHQMMIQNRDKANA